MAELTDIAIPIEPSLHDESEGKPVSSGSAPRVMRRRRSFLAEPSKAQNDFSPRPNPLLEGEDDDLPVLTEVVSVETPVAEPKAKHLDEAQISLLASVIAHAVEQQIADDLPGLLETAQRQASESLRAGISVSVENALRDVLSRYK